MKKFVFISVCLVSSLFGIAQGEVSGIAFGLNGITGKANTSYESFSVAGYALSLRFVPPKARMFGLTLQLQTGASSVSEYYNFIGLGILTRPLAKVYTRFQPYLGVEAGSGLAGYYEENESVTYTSYGDTLWVRKYRDNDFRLIVSPIVGLEYFAGKKFAFDVAFKYDLYLGSPMIYGKIFKFGFNVYPF